MYSLLSFVVSTLASVKLIFLPALIVSLAMAAELTQLEDRARRPHKRSRRPKKHEGGSFTFRSAKRPSGAPDDYKVGTDRATRKQSKAELQKLPTDLIDC